VRRRAVAVVVALGFEHAVAVDTAITLGAIPIVETLRLGADPVDTQVTRLTILIGPTLGLDAVAVDALVSGRAIPVVEALRFDANEVDTAESRRAVKIILTLGLEDAASIDAMVAGWTVKIGETFRSIDAGAVDTAVLRRAIPIAQALRGVDTFTVDAAMVRRTVAVVYALRGVDAKALDAAIARWTIDVAEAFRSVDALAVDAAVARLAVPIVLAFRLDYALSVFTNEPRRTGHIGTGIVDALIVFTNISIGTVAVAHAHLDTVAHDAPLPRRTIIVVEALLALADIADTELAGRAVGIGLAGVMYALATFTMIAGIASHVFTRVMVDA